jgi:hypothetical protein
MQVNGLLARLLQNIDDPIAKFATFKKNAITKIWESSSPHDLHALRGIWLEKEVKPNYIDAMNRLPYKAYNEDLAVIAYRSLDRIDHIKLVMMLMNDIDQTHPEFMKLVFHMGKQFK